MSQNGITNEGTGDFLSEIFDRRWEIIDCHTHLYSYNYFRLLSQIPGRYGDLEQHMRQQARRMKIDLPPADPVGLAERWVAEMDRYSLSRICLLAGVPGDEYSITRALRSYPEQFIGFVVVNPHLSVAEEVLEHAVRIGGVKGICLHPSRHRFHAADERVYPIYRQAKRHRLVVYVNYGLPQCPMAAKWGAPDNHDLRFNNPEQLHFAASDFPTVPFVISHFLEGHIRELLRLGLLCPNVHASVFPVDHPPETSDDSLDFEGLLDLILKAFGPKRILFGTGSGCFPQGWRNDTFRSVLHALQSLRVSDERIGMILGGNLKRLLRLDDSRQAYLVTL